jgi:nitrate/nitrite-specific signal transduction histidine kinase
MKIGHQLILGSVTFLLLLLVTLVATFSLFMSGSSDALYVNLAGRQRMLSQKISKEALSYATNPSPAARAELERSMLVFDRTHKALRMSGMAPLGLNNTQDAPIQGTTDPALGAKLDEVGQLWASLSAATRDVQAESEAGAAALSSLETALPRGLLLSDAVIAAMTDLDAASPELVNVAGRQRMLSQKVGFDALLYQARRTAALRDTLLRDMKLMEASHRALRYGGHVQLSLSDTRKVFLPAPTDPEVIRNLDQVEEVWQEVSKSVATLASDSAAAGAVARLSDVNPKLLRSMDQAVTLSQKLADAKVRTLRNIQLATLGAGLLLVLAAIVFAGKLAAALNKLRVAAEQISLGRMSARVNTIGMGEIKDLSHSFERMRSSLEASMLDLERREGLSADL